MKFTLTDHIYRILTGSEDGISKGRKMQLICQAKCCLHHPDGCEDKNFGRLIEPKGYGICPHCQKQNCKTKIDIEDMVKRGNKRIVQCPNMSCRSQLTFTIKQIIWTVKVISKHRRGKHYYYHEECYDAMYVDPSDPEPTDEELKEFFNSFRYGRK